jgi:hypothetical protein
VPEFPARTSEAVCRTRIPSSNADFRQQIFNGTAFLTPPDAASLQFINLAGALARDVLKVEDIRNAHRELDAETFFERIGKLRRTIYLDKEYQSLAFDVLESCGVARDRCAFDPFRLRVVTPGGHLNQRAAPVYFPHRDTWYAHPQSLIVLWIPLHDLAAEETFVFYPDYFQREVPNNSEVFNYDDWIKDGPELRIGWQDRDSGIKGVYPRSAESFDAGKGLGFSTAAGEHLFFSGAHYHKTLPQDTAKTRYSLDIRFVHLDDVSAGAGAPNADNRSRGSTLKDYVRA